MQVIQSLDVDVHFKNPVLTMGNYDGIHLGHRRIIERVKEKALEISGTSMLMTFDPHPLHVLRPERELAAITPLEEKKRIIQEAGIEVLLILPFTRELSLIPPETFVASVLVDRLSVKGVVIGYDFKFGRGGGGDTALLQEMGRRYGFLVEVIAPVTVDGEKVGSNRIRKLVRDGQVENAAKLLGRYYGVEGRVVRAKGRGGTIVGYPTMNLDTHYHLIPKNGVYVTEAEIEGRRFEGVTNVGHNPTFESGQQRSIETFILGFEGDLYDKEVRLTFLTRLRDEVKFGSVDALKGQIAKDVGTAREYFDRRADAS